MPNVVHVDIPADDTERARKFYERLFDWKFEAPPGEIEYYLFEPTGAPEAPGMGLGKRGAPDQRITVYFGVDSIAKYLKRVEELGGKVSLPYMPVPSFGGLAICVDTENNTFGLFEPHPES